MAQKDVFLYLQPILSPSQIPRDHCRGGAEEELPPQDAAVAELIDVAPQLLELHWGRRRRDLDTRRHKHLAIHHLSDIRALALAQLVQEHGRVAGYEIQRGG
jgi:hypothetical protein